MQYYNEVMKHIIICSNISGHKIWAKATKHQGYNFSTEAIYITKHSLNRRRYSDVCSPSIFGRGNNMSDLDMNKTSC